jgi:hypothetical protein
VLDLPDGTLRELLVNTLVSVPSLVPWKAESLLESNPIAEWLDNRIVIDASAKSYVGVPKKSGRPAVIRATTQAVIVTSIANAGFIPTTSSIATRSAIVTFR